MEGLRVRGCGALVSLGLLLAGPAAAQTLFTEVTREAGFSSSWGGRGKALGDWNNDGWLEMCGEDDSGPRSDNWSSYLLLLNNQGDGTLAEQTAAIQLEPSAQRWGGGMIFGDYDNDGDLDIFAPRGQFWSTFRLRNLLLRNDRGIFQDVTLAAGLTDSLPTDNAIWLDYDRDGHLDLYTGNLGCGPPNDPTVRNKLYRNKGDGSFADMTREAGLDVQLNPECGGSNGGMAAGDFNDDGWPDLYVGVFQDRKRLFLNDGKGGFRDATTSEIGQTSEAFGVAVGDIDNDGDLEIFQATSGGPGGLLFGERPILWLNLGNAQLLDITEGAGLSGLGTDLLGAGLADLDNDGDLDLTAWNRRDDLMFLYLNEGEGTFVAATARAGWQGASDLQLFGDYDLDGFLDGWFGGSLYRNNGNGNHYLRVELVGVKSNRNGIGARVTATAGDLRQMREILGGRGYEQDEMAAHFGLGERTQVDRLEIRWPSGQVDVLTDIPADQKIRVIEGREGYEAAHPTRATVDTLVAGSATTFKATVWPALFEKSAQVTQVLADLSSLGGPAAMPLVEAGEGAYKLEYPLVVEQNGLKDILITIDQSTSLGPYWTQLLRQVTVVPGEDLVIFDEALAPGWQAEGNSRIKRLDLSEAGVVQRGSLAGAFAGGTTRSSWSVTFKTSAPLDLTGYTALRFAFHPGEVVPSSAARLTAALPPGKAVSLLDSGWVDLNRKEWQVVEIPMEAFERTGPITSLRFQGNLEGTFYLDDLRLVAATPPPVTVVEEDHTTALPQTFALSQNFPNPFNSDTAIRFALPESGEVELEVFNLAGQQVVKLVQGQREAGTYTIRWDGRDERGKELASGIYLYRLRAGAQVETRKLVLVR